MIVEDPQKKRIRPSPVGQEHAHRTVVKVQVPQGAHILTLVTADLARLVAMLGPTGAGTVRGAATRALEESVRLHEAHDRTIGRDGPEGRIFLDPDREVVGMELVTPTGMLAVLADQVFADFGPEGRVLALVGADLASEGTERVLRVAGGVVPAFEGRNPELNRLATDRMAPGPGGQQQSSSCLSLSLSSLLSSSSLSLSSSSGPPGGAAGLNTVPPWLAHAHAGIGFCI